MTIEIRDVTLRDGIQSLAQVAPTSLKIELLRRIAAAGVSEIEAASMLPVTSRIRQFLDVEEMVDAGRSLSGPRISVLTPNVRGAQRAMTLGVDKIVYLLSASESFSQANVRRPVAATLDGLRAVAAMIRAAHPATRPRLSAAVSCAFGCPIEGAGSPGAVRRLAAAAAEAGADEIALADTIGCAEPPQVAGLFGALRAEFPALALAAHFHDNRGLAVANALSSVEAGADALDVALSGAGGCPNVPEAHANLSIEALLPALAHRGIPCDVQPDKVREARAFAARALPFLFPSAHDSQRSPSQ